MKLLCNQCMTLIPAKPRELRNRVVCCPQCRTLSPVQDLLNLDAVTSAATLPRNSGLRVEIQRDGDYVIHGYNAGTKYSTGDSRRILFIMSALMVLITFLTFFYAFPPLIFLAFMPLLFLVNEIRTMQRISKGVEEIILHADSIEILSHHNRELKRHVIPLYQIRQIYMERDTEHHHPSTEGPLERMAAKFKEIPVISDGSKNIPIGITWHPLEKRWLVNFLDLVVKMRKFRLERLSA